VGFHDYPKEAPTAADFEVAGNDRPVFVCNAKVAAMVSFGLRAQGHEPQERLLLTTGPALRQQFLGVLGLLHVLVALVTAPNPNRPGRTGRARTGA
jgi:hypothetical protein